MKNRFKQIEKVKLKLGLEKHDPTLVMSVPENTGSKFKYIGFCRLSSLGKVYEQYKNELEIWWLEVYKDKIKKRYGLEFASALIEKESLDEHVIE